MKTLNLLVVLFICILTCVYGDTNIHEKSLLAKRRLVRNEKYIDHKERTKTIRENLDEEYSKHKELRRKELEKRDEEYFKYKKIRRK